MIIIHPEVRDHLLASILLRERPKLHEIAAKYYQEQHDYLEAAYHWREAAAFEQAAHILIKSHETIINAGQTEALQTLLAEFHTHSLKPNIWIQLKIVAGDVAILVKDIDTALNEYGLALSTKGADKYHRASAYHRRARAYELRNFLRESLLHYQKGIELLKNQGKHQELLVDMYTDRAWIYIQERPNLAKAEADLMQAQTRLPEEDHRRRAILHNAWVEICWQRDDQEQGFFHCLEAWMAATEAHDNDLMVITGHNLGHEYIWRDEYDKGLFYLEKALDLAEQIGDRQHEAKCHKAIGACYTLDAEAAQPQPDEGKFEKAICHLHQAYSLFLKLDNTNWLGEVCHDLANAYAGIGDIMQGQRYYKEAVEIAQKGNAERLQKDLNRLVIEYHPILAFELDDNQLLALTTAKKENGITNRRYRELTGVTRRTATVHLNKLVTMELLKQIDSGRSARYVLNR